MLRIVPASLASAVFCAAFIGAPSREDIAYVAPARAALVGLPQAAEAPVLAEVLSGCAVRVLEKRDGMVRVAVEGWVAENLLTKEPPFPLPPHDESPAPAGRPSNEPVADLALAHHLGVEGVLKKNGDAPEYTFVVDLRTEQGRPVVVPGSKQSCRLRVYVERRVAGEPVKGDVLLDRTIELADGKATLAIAAKDLSIPAGTRALFLSARCELGGARIVHGTAADVVVAGR